MRGDEFNKISLSFLSSLYDSAWRPTGNDADAEDLVQQTYETAFRHARELARVAAAREARGAGLKVDVKRAEARVGNDEGNLTEAATTFRRASVALALTLELEAAVTILPASPAVKQMRLVDPDESLGGLIELALRQRPDLSEQGLRVDAAASKAKGAWAEAFGPDLYGFFEESAIGRSIGALDTRQLYGGSVGVTLRPESISSARAARARLAMAKLEEQRMWRRIAGQVIATRESVLGAREQMEAALRRVHAAEASLQLSQARFKGGVGISLEVLEAQASLTRATPSFPRSPGTTPARWRFSKPRAVYRPRHSAPPRRQAR